MGNRCKKFQLWAKKNVLYILTVIGIIFGIILGLSLRVVISHVNSITWLELVMWISLPGELYIRMLKMLILPIIVCTLITGVSSLDPKASSRIGVITLVYIFGTQVVAVVIGIFLGMVIQPGNSLDFEIPENYKEDRDTSYADVIADLFRNMVPENILQAASQSVKTTLTISTELINGTNATTVNRSKTYINGMNTVGIIVFSFCFGVAARTVGKDARPLLKFCEAVNKCIFVFMKAVCWYSPIGIMFLIASAIMKISNLGIMFTSMGWFTLAVLVGLFTHGFIVLPLLHLAFVRTNPFKYLFAFIEAFFNGLMATSSAAALPFMYKNCAEKKMDSRVTNFTLPICVTMNRDGSVIFIGIAIIFLAQSYSITLFATDVILLGVLTTALSVSVAMVPSSSVVVILLVGGSLNIPVQDSISMLFALEWLLDRLRTLLNIVSHVVCAGIVVASCRDPIDSKAEELNVCEKENDGTLLHPNCNQDETGI